MRRMMMIGAAALLLAGCAASEPTTVEPASVEPTTAEPTMSDEEIQRTAMELAWQDMTAEDKEAICWGWDTMGPGWVVDQVLASMPDASPELVREFFGGKC